MSSSIEDSASSLSETQDKSAVLFTNDQGTLPADTRRVLVLLLLGPSIDSRRQPKLWQVILRDEAVIRSRLHELFLELVIDRKHEVAFTRQISSDDLEAPILLRRAQLTFVESALVLYLRLRLIECESEGERAVVSYQDMVDHLSVFERHTNVDRSRFAQQVARSIDKVKDLNFIHKIRNSENRYEVSPTLKLLFPAEEIVALTEQYARLIASPEMIQTTSILTATPDDPEE